MGFSDQGKTVFKSTSTQHGKRVTQTAINLKNVIPAFTLRGPESLLQAWQEHGRKSWPQYLSYDKAAAVSGMDVGEIASNLKAIHKADPEAVGFAVDRMGNNVAFRVKKPDAFMGTRGEAPDR